jgi:hypothetical protein
MVLEVAEACLENVSVEGSLLVGGVSGGVKERPLCVWGLVGGVGGGV